jgi:hypothetical protein
VRVVVISKSPSIGELLRPLIEGTQNALAPDRRPVGGETYIQKKPAVVAIRATVLLVRAGGQIFFAGRLY